MWSLKGRLYTSVQPWRPPDWLCALILAAWLGALGMFGSRDVVTSLAGLGLLAIMWGVAVWDIRRSRQRGRERVRPPAKEVKKGITAISLGFVFGMMIASLTEHKSVPLSIALAIGCCVLFVQQAIGEASEDRE